MSLVSNQLLRWINKLLYVLARIVLVIILLLFIFVLLLSLKPVKEKILNRLSEYVATTYNAELLVQNYSYVFPLGIKLKNISFSDTFSKASIKKLKIRPNSFSKRKSFLKVKVSVSQGEIYINTASFKKDSLTMEKNEKVIQGEKKNWIISSDVKLDQIHFSFEEKKSEIMIGVQVKSVFVNDARIETIKHVVNWEDILIDDCTVKINLDKKEEINETESKVDWRFKGDNITLKNCYFNLNQEFKGFYLSAFTKDLEIRMLLVDLQKQLIEVNKLEINLAEVSDRIAVDTANSNNNVEENGESWKVSLNTGKLKQVKFSHNWDKDTSADSVFSFQSFAVKNLDTKIKKVFYYEKCFGGIFNDFNLILNEKIFIDDSYISGSFEQERTHLNLKLNSGEGKVLLELDSENHWTSLTNLQEFPVSKLSLKIDRLNQTDLFYFIPNMQSFSKWLNESFNFELEAKSFAGLINVEKLFFHIEPGLDLKASGNISDFSGKNSFRFHSDYVVDVNLKNFTSLFAEKNMESYMSAIEKMEIQGKISGNQDCIFIDQLLTSEYMKLPLTGFYYPKDSSYRINLTNAFLDIDSIFSFPVRLDSFNFSSFGHLAKSADKNYNLNIKRFSIFDHIFQNLNLSDSLCDEQVEGTLISTDSSFSANLSHSFNFGKNKQASLSGEFQLINTGGIEKLPVGIFGAFIMASFAKDTSSSFIADFQFNDFKARIDDKYYYIAKNSIHIESLKNSFIASYENDFSTSILSSDLTLNELKDSVMQGIQKFKELDSHYISDIFPLLSSTVLSIDVRPHTLIDDFILKDKFGFNHLHVEFRDEDNKREELKIRIDKPQFLDIVAGSLEVFAEFSSENMLTRSSVQDLEGKNIVANQLLFNTTTEKNFTRAEIKSYAKNNNSQLYAKLNINRGLQSVIVTLPIDSIILFGDAWNVNTNNIISFSRSFIDTCDFEINSGSKILKIGTNSSCPLYAELSNLNLENISKIVFRKNQLSGILDCKLCFLNKSLNSLSSELVLRDIVLDGKEHGRYNVSAYYDASDSMVLAYGGELFYNDEQKLQLTAKTSEKKFINSTIEAKITNLELSPYSPFLSKYLNSISGNISGYLKMSPENIKDGIRGELSYHNLIVNPKVLNTELFLSDNALEIKDRKLLLNKLTAKNASDKKLKVNGEIRFPFSDDPIIDIKVRGDSMLIVNIPERKNNSFFGKAFATNDLEISGPIRSPEINYNLKLLGGTDFTYRIVNNLSSKSGEGVVVFVGEENAQYPNNESGESLIYKKEGADIDATIVIDPKTIFRIVYEQNMKFTIRLSGSGNVKYLKKSAGEEQMKGKYTVRSGEAIMDLQGLAPKDFKISPQSFVQWDGSSSDPVVDILAYHMVKGSYQNPAGGVAQTMIVDYKVFFAIKNRLSNPEIAFNVETKDDYMTTVLNAMPEEERIKQAINLLLLGQIVTDNTKASGSKIITDHINQFWAQQMNKAAENRMGGVSLNVDIQSFTDHSAGNQYDRTNLSYELSKKVWNDKATVKVGGYVSKYNNSPDQAPSRMIGDVSLEYDLGKDENLYGKVFSDYKYEGVLEGEIQRTGAGIMYKKNYRTFKDIWRRKKNKKPKKKK